MTELFARPSYKGVHVNFACDSNVIHTSMNIKKIAFVTHICIIYHPLFGEKSDTRVKTEIRKQLHAIFSLTANSVVDVISSPLSIQGIMVYF